MKRLRALRKVVSSLYKASIGIVVEVPLAVLSDVLTMGGILTQRKSTHTKDALFSVFLNIAYTTR